MCRPFLGFHGLRRLLVRGWAWAWLLWCATLAMPAAAQGVDLNLLRLNRGDSAVTLDYNARLRLQPSIEEVLQRGVPLYFVAQATLWRGRWYWRDERVSRVTRTWRVAYQPLTATWRVSLGGLSQAYGSLSEALAPLSRVSGWPLVESDRLEPGERYYVEFSFRLDPNQLPPPMQIDLASDWKLSVERSLRLE